MFLLPNTSLAAILLRFRKLNGIQCIQWLAKGVPENRSHPCFTATPNFEASTAIPNAIDISRTLCNPRDHVETHHFPERIDAKRQWFYFLYKYLGITDRKQLG